MPSFALLNCIDSLINEWNTLYENICFPSFTGIGCPIPFFGNIESGKPLVFTLGTNPSDREFLSINKYPSPVRLLNPSMPYTSRDLFNACSHYFNVHPYKGWFGAPGSAKIEGFLNVINNKASYYGNNLYQAVHVDLIPFPTLAKFSCFRLLNSAHVSRMMSLGKGLIDILIHDYQPKEIICIGRDACSLLSHVGKSTTAGHSFNYYRGSINGVKAFGTSVYYPNPHGSTPSNWQKDIIPLM
jgi:hypothetical protein